METKVLLGKFVFGLVGTAFSVLSCWWLDRAKIPWHRFKWMVWAVFVLTRAGLFTGLFVILHFSPQSDVTGFYYPRMKAALAGEVPYRDFISAYAPLFPYEGAAVLWLHDSAKALVLLSIGFEAAGFAAWLGFAHRAFSERTARFAAFLYVVNALPLFNAAIDGQNQTWISAFLGLSVLMLSRRRWFQSGVVFGGALVAVKILPLIFAPAVWLHAAKRRYWLLGFLVLPVIVYGTCLHAGLNILQPLRSESKEITSGCLPFLLAPFFPAGFPATAFDTILVVMLGCGCVVGALRLTKEQPQRCVYLLTMLLLILLVFSKKAFTNYLVMAWFPLCLCAAAPAAYPVRNACLLGLFGTLALVEPSLWFRWLDRQSLVSVLAAWRHAEVSGGWTIRLLVFLLCDVMLIGAYVWYGLQAWKLYAATTDETRPTLSDGAGSV